ncbi:MAG: T9SS type A sorting domain-containing protein, partial [Bacteroidota bacterium]
FTPNSSQWRTDSVDLVGYSDESNLQIAFRNIGRYGNVLYLDNINIGNTANVSENQNEKPNIYPNPVKAGESLAIEFEGEFIGYLIDQKGSKIQFHKAKDSLMFSIPESISSGLYILQVQTSSKVWNKPLIILK